MAQRVNPFVGRPRKIRAVVRWYKAAKYEGRPKVARDYDLGLTVESIDGKYDRPCEGRCIWGGAIEAGQFFARLDSGVRRRMNKSMIPVTADYHFSCLPRAAMPLRRFFEPLPYRSTLCLNGDISHRLFHNIAEWEAWMRTHYPSMKGYWAGGGVGWRQYGTGYYWCAINLRPSFRKPETGF